MISIILYITFSYLIVLDLIYQLPVTIVTYKSYY